VIVYGHRQRLFGSFLPDHVLAQLLINLLWGWNLACLQARPCNRRLLLFDNLPAEVDTFITDVNATWAGNESLYLILALATK